MEKSPDAFRTISEVADLLETPAHVLRFWETRFPQIRPVKRAGGRRYYRPGDVALLAGIKRLLHDEGMTIRGVQKVLRDQGVRHVSGLADAATVAVEPEESIEAQLAAALGPVADPDAGDTPPETAQIIALETVLAQKDAPRANPDRPAIIRDLFDPAPDPSPETTRADEPEEAPFEEVIEAEPAAPVVSFPPAHTAADPVPPAPATAQDSVQDSVQAPETAHESTSTVDRAALMARLRRMRAGAATAELAPLRQRLVALRDRLGVASRKTLE